MSLATDYLAYFREMFPEFVDVQDSTILFWIEAAMNELDKCMWSNEFRFKQALMWLSAHLLYLKISIENGEVTPTLGGAKKVEAGEVEVEYTGAGDKLTSNGDAIYLQTRYGTEFVRLRDKSIAGVFCYGGGC